MQVWTFRFYALGAWNIKHELTDAQVRDLVDMCVNNGLHFEAIPMN